MDLETAEWHHKDDTGDFEPLRLSMGAPSPASQVAPKK